MRQPKSVFCFLFLSLVVSGLPSILLGWEEKTSDHFVVKHHRNNATLATSALRSLERAYPRVTADIGHALDRPVRVYVATSDREFRFLTRGALPDWGIGAAFPDSGLIILKAAAELVSGSDLDEVAVHELSHVVLGQALQGKRVPRWFDEGLAMYESREWNIGQSFVMTKAVFTRSVIPLRSIDGVLQFKKDKAQLAYTESFLAISYIIREYGLEAFQQIVRTLAQTGNLDGTLQAVTGLRFSEFEIEWFKYVRSRYGWISLFTNSFYLWIGISLLFILVFLAKRYRTKRTMERWETEDEGYHFDNEQDYYDY